MVPILADNNTLNIAEKNDSGMALADSTVVVALDRGERKSKDCYYEQVGAIPADD